MKILDADINKKFWGSIVPKLKFAATSSLATAVDYFLYMLLVTYFLAPVPSNIISRSVGVIINFILQKQFVFILKRNITDAFALSILFSVIGIALSTLFIYGLSQITFFNENQAITKLIVTGILFFYNFYTKRFAFQKGK